MTTYKYNGKMLTNDDTMLWRQMIDKEQFLKGQQI